MRQRASSRVDQLIPNRWRAFALRRCPLLFGAQGRNAEPCRVLTMFSLPRPSVSPAVAAAAARAAAGDVMGPLTVCIVSYGIHGFE